MSEVQYKESVSATTRGPDGNDEDLAQAAVELAAALLSASDKSRKRAEKRRSARWDWPTNSIVSGLRWAIGPVLWNARLE